MRKSSYTALLLLLLTGTVSPSHAMYAPEESTTEFSRYGRVAYTPEDGTNQVSQSSFSSDSDSSSPDDLPEHTEKNADNPARYYSSDFNEIITELSAINQENKGPLLDSLPQWEKLHTIGDSFVNNAITYERVIIKEHAQPLSLKTIRPVNVGGVAGGDKYIVQGILFKFAKDQNVYGNTWLYGGKKPNEYLAAKSAGQELLSANYVEVIPP